MPDKNPTSSAPKQTRRNRPASRRKRNHAAVTNEPRPVLEIDHDLVPDVEPIWIDTQEALDEMLAHIRELGCCTYDTEFIGEETYFPVLCLIQLATADRIAVVDALAEIDITDVWQLLADASVVKIVHAGLQDIEPVVRHLGVTAANVFDTQIAAGLAALPYPLSLAKLIKELLGVKPPKGLTYTSWDERPMSPAHLQYAADDVRFGLALHEALMKRLDQLDHVELAELACEDQCDPVLFQFNAETQFNRVRGAKGLQGKHRAVLLKLVEWRDQSARKANLPVRVFCKDEVVLALAKKPLADLKQLDQARWISRQLRENHGEAIVNVTAEALSMAHDKRPAKSHREPLPNEIFGIDQLHTAIAAYCLSHGVDPSLVASRKVVAKLYLSLDQKDKAPRFGRIGRGWREKFIGQWLKKYLQGDSEVTLKFDPLLLEKSE